MTRCRVCGCTQENACNPPCGWQPGAGNLCTSCAFAAETVAQWLDIAVRANTTALIREAGQIFRGEALLHRNQAADPPKRKAKR